MRKRVLKFLFGFVLIPAGVAAVFFSLEKNGFFNVDHIELIVHETPESPAYMQGWMKSLDSALEKYRGQSLLKIDLQEISGLIAQENWIRDVTLTRRLPSRIRVVIEPKQVEYLYVARGGKFFPVVEDGSFLDAIDPRLAPDVPLLMGENFVQKGKEELRRKSVQILKEIPLEGSFSRKTISEVRFDEKEGFGMTLIKDGIRVKIGEDQIAMKSARVSQVIDYMAVHNFQPRVIDANLSKKVLVRLRKDP